MTFQLNVQYASEEIKNYPSEEDFKTWVNSVLNKFSSEGIELTIRIIDKEDMQTLNRDFRKIDKHTNVLSFPFEPIPDQEINYLGDIAICAEVVMEEAEIQKKDPASHWAHLTIHGVLHLLGYDHVDDKEAEEMEGLEVVLMKDLGFDDPYR